MIFHLLLLYEYCGSLYHFICSRRASKVEETQSNSTDSTEVSGAGLEVENRREKLFIIDMLKGGDADNKPEKVTVITNQSNLYMIFFIISHTNMMTMMMMIPIL